MRATQILTLLREYLPIIFLVLFVGHFTRVRYLRGVRSVPGPWLASFTDAWRAYAVSRGRFDLTNRALHQKYGDLVRIGPKCISVADPYEIPKIYGIQRIFPKVSYGVSLPLSTAPNFDYFLVQSDYYTCSQAIVNGKRVAGLFQTTDEEVHKRAKRPIAHAYAMTTLLDYEALVDSTSTVLLERLKTLFAKPGRACPFDQWLQWYAFDVIGEVTFSCRLGFLEQGTDVGNMINILSHAGWYTAVVGQMPWLDVVLQKNWLSLKLFKPRILELPLFVMGILQQRLQKDKEIGQGKDTASVHKDFLSKFSEAATLHAGKIPSSMYLGWAMSNINAGSDTTAISLRAIFCECCIIL